jgi:transcriptional regulator with XRE-family HTH domain
VSRPNASTRRAEADRCRIHAAILQLKAIRVIQGLSQGDVAKTMGTTQSAISEMEALPNNDLNVGTLMRYARAVGACVSISVEEVDTDGPAPARSRWIG